MGETRGAFRGVISHYRRPFSRAKASTLPTIWGDLPFDFLEHGWAILRMATNRQCIGASRRELGSVELGCQGRWLVGYLRMKRRIHLGRCCQSRGPLRRIFGWVNRYDRQKLTRKSMPEPDRMAGTIGSAEYEFAPLQGYRLGFIAGFDREPRHHPRCRLRRRQNREQVGCNRHSRQGLWHRSFSGERGYGRANEQAMDRYCTG